ncbi:hypothetical protein ACU8M5_10710 [Rhizobium leguminosarum]
MADEVSENMVLRTVYLPKDLDLLLKAAAFRDSKSKNDLIRELIQTGIATMRSDGDKRFSTIEPKGGRKPVSVQAPVRKVDDTARARVNAARRKRLVTAAKVAVSK